MVTSVACQTQKALTEASPLQLTNVGQGHLSKWARRLPTFDPGHLPGRAWQYPASSFILSAAPSPLGQHLFRHFPALSPCRARKESAAPREPKVVAHLKSIGRSCSPRALASPSCAPAVVRSAESTHIRSIRPRSTANAWRKQRLCMMWRPIWRICRRV